MLSRVERSWRERLGDWAQSTPFAALAGERTEDGWRLKPAVRPYRWLALFVVLPTLVTALYLYLVAADQYVSETRFLVRSAESSAGNSVLGAMLGGAQFRSTAEETAGVQDYLVSHDAVAALSRHLNLKSMFKRPMIDVLGRYNGSGDAEGLLKYYKRQVAVESDSNSGVLTLKVRAFTPRDSRLIAESLLAESEQLVNRFNDRAQADALAVARTEVARSEARVAQMHDQMASFRDRERSLDPAKSSAMVTTVIGGIEGELSKARTELSVQSAFLKPGNPKLMALSSRVTALQRQVDTQNARLTGGAGSMAPAVSGFERLSLEREFADKEYTTAMASLEAARVDAQKKHLYLIRVVEPNTPQRSLYPQRGLVVLTVFLSLLVAYGIGWLIIAGIREHAA
jgi:capsular polysaccharide transport system permease protein